MTGRSNGLILGGVLVFAAAVLAPTAASARTFERCDVDGHHCVRVTCDRDGDRCWRQSEYYRNSYYRHPGRWVCDHDGDRCHYVYRHHKWEPHWD